MVDLVLDDLRRPAGKGLEPGLELFILPLHLDDLEPLRFPPSGQGQTALLRFVGPGLLHDDGIEHDHIFPLVIKRDDALIDADHVGGHTHAALLVGGQRVQQIPRRLKILQPGTLRPLGQKSFISANITNHSSSCGALRPVKTVLSPSTDGSVSKRRPAHTAPEAHAGARRSRQPACIHRSHYIIICRRAPVNSILSPPPPFSIEPCILLLFLLQ